MKNKQLHTSLTNAIISFQMLIIGIWIVCPLQAKINWAIFFLINYSTLPTWQSQSPHTSLGIQPWCICHFLCCTLFPVDCTRMLAMIVRWHTYSNLTLVRDLTEKKRCKAILFIELFFMKNLWFFSLTYFVSLFFFILLLGKQTSSFLRSITNFKIRLLRETDIWPINICYLSAGRSVSWKTVTEVLKMLPEAAGRGQHFQGRGHSFSRYGPTQSR